MAALRVLIVVAIVLVAGCATRPLVPSLPSVSGPPGTIYILHAGPTSLHATVGDNGADAAKIEGQKYIRLSASAGPHHISSEEPSFEAPGEAIDIDVQPKSPYYVQVSQVCTVRLWSQALTLAVLTGASQGWLFSQGKRCPGLGVFWPVKSISAEEAQCLMKEMALQNNFSAE
jgi:hypothetical protein